MFLTLGASPQAGGLVTSVLDAHVSIVVRILSPLVITDAEVYSL